MIVPESFSVGSERTGQVHRLTPVGELDLATAPMLERAFDAAYRDGTADTTFVVDLTQLSFMDSTGLTLLLRMNDTCEGTDRLRVINGSPAVERLFDIAGVRRLLPIIHEDADPLAPLRPTTPTTGFEQE